MNNNRMNALETVRNRKATKVTKPANKISDYFGSNVFGKEAMHEHLRKSTYKALMQAIEKGTGINKELADEVASGMKYWASEKGVTHYTHWFQPLTGSTAEKHDSFFTLTGDGKAIEKFSGSALAQQEPDASSFPSGGIRNTFEARGYTAWDPTSPAFIFENPAGKTLCIPTVFVSYTGQSLDYKAPLLKSLDAIEKASVAVCGYFHRDVNKVSPTLGIEQEYFLIDEALYHARPDLVLSGRTLFGHSPARGQQLDDHYFGSIEERVLAYMVEFETEAHKLGIPLMTRHNEVAPGQYECAPLFHSINLSIDHNQLLMDVMKKVAKKHKLAVLFHEKPFAGLNGSGKHNNWSLITNTGINLLAPGKTPKKNLEFLTFFVNTLKAFYDHADLIRAAIASAGNDHRLGANEAPPAIMSAFIGSTLSQMLDEIESKKFKDDEKQAQEMMRHGIKNIPEILLDNTDRNRTSPFAFTGNKFELRAVGSAANSSFVMTIMNAIVANQLNEFKLDYEELRKEGLDKNQSILSVLRKYIKASKSIRFEGNGYGDEWVKEAKKRGLPNVKSTPLALDALVSKKAISLFEKMNVFTAEEIEARHEVMLENYQMKVQIESRMMVELVHTHILPSALNYQNTLIENIRGQKEIGIKKSAYEEQLKLVEKISEHISKIKSLSEKMLDERKKANKISDSKKQAIAYCDKIKETFFEEIRYHVDKLEIIVDDNFWTLPKYRELLFNK